MSQFVNLQRSETIVPLSAVIPSILIEIIVRAGPEKDRFCSGTAFLVAFIAFALVVVLVGLVSVIVDLLAYFQLVSLISLSRGGTWSLLPCPHSEVFFFLSCRPQSASGIGA